MSVGPLGAQSTISGIIKILREFTFQMDIGISLGHCWEPFGATLAPLGRPWAPLGRPLGVFDAPWGLFGPYLGRP